jgi:hypothetical protein
MKFDQLVLLVEADKSVKVSKTYWDKAETKLKSEIWYNPDEANYDDELDYENDVYDVYYFHRLDGPAYQVWYKNGQKKKEVWFKDDNYHRLDGPAMLAWDKNGNKTEERYFINNKELLPNEFKHLAKQYNKEDIDILNDLNS